CSQLRFAILQDAHQPELHSFPTRRSSDLLVSKQVRDREVGDGTEEKIRCGDQEADHVTGLDPPRRAQKKRDQHSGQDGERKDARSEEHTSELQSPDHLVCRLLLEKKKKKS